MFTITSIGHEGFSGRDVTLELLRVSKRLPAKVDILCDTTDDLPGSDIVNTYGFAPGSIALIANERTYKILNNAKQWVLLISLSAIDNGGGDSPEPDEPVVYTLSGSWRITTSDFTSAFDQPYHIAANHVREGSQYPYIGCYFSEDESPAMYSTNFNYFEPAENYWINEGHEITFDDPVTVPEGFYNGFTSIATKIEDPILSGTWQITRSPSGEAGENFSDDFHLNAPHMVEGSEYDSEAQFLGWSCGDGLYSTDYDYFEPAESRWIEAGDKITFNDPVTVPASFYDAFTYMATQV